MIYSDEFLALLREGIPSRNTNRFSKKKQEFFFDLIKLFRYDWLLKYTPAQSHYLIINQMIEFPRCKNSNCNKEVFRHGAKYCNQHCYKTDSVVNKKIGDIKKKLYSDPDWKESVENKRKLTHNKNWGCSFPMQHPGIREKHEKNCYQSKEYKGMVLRGYEPIILDYFIEKGLTPNVDIILGTTAMSQYNWRFIGKSGNHLFPDFYIPQFHSFIEVKSDYTLMKDQNKLLEIEDVIEDECGADYYILAYIDDKIQSADIRTLNLSSNKFNNTHLMSLIH